MKRTILAVLVLGSGTASMAACPPVSAPRPTKPVAPPPQWIPEIRAPKTIPFGEEATAKFEIVPPPPEKLATPGVGPDGLIDVEDGHVTMILRARSMFQREPRHPTPPWSARIEGTPLASFRLVGYAPQSSPNRITRYFERDDGTAVMLEEWDFAADGGAVFAPRDRPTVRLGPHTGTFAGVRGQLSGCVSTAISWGDGRRHRKLELVGPQDVRGQRELLESIAGSIVAQR